MEKEFRKLIITNSKVSEKDSRLLFQKTVALLKRGLDINKVINHHAPWECVDADTIFEHLHRYFKFDTKASQYLSILMEQYGAVPTGTSILIDIQYHKGANLRLLLEHGADPNAFVTAKVHSSTSYYPIEYAYHKYQLDSFELLLQYGADPDLINPYYKAQIFNDFAALVIKRFRDRIEAYSGGKGVKAATQ